MLPYWGKYRVVSLKRSLGNATLSLDAMPGMLASWFGIQPERREFLLRAHDVEWFERVDGRWTRCDSGWSVFLHDRQDEWEANNGN